MPPPPVELEDLLSHADWLKRLARGLVRDEASADDVVQDTYAAALRKPPPAHVMRRSWLAGVVKNMARQRWRSETRRHAREQRVAEKRQDLPSTDELAARLELQRLVAGVVLKLDEPYRSTVVLRYFENMSSVEIARRADVSSSTVRWRLKRGLELMRARLDGAHAGGRAAWVGAMSPMAGTSMSAGTAVVAMGASMAMNAKTTVGLAALVVLLVGGISVALISLRGGRDETASTAKGAGAAREPEGDAHGPPGLVAREANKVLPSRSPSGSASSGPGERSPGRAARSLEDTPLWPAPPAPATATMQVRIVDPEGRPIPRVELMVLTGTPGRGTTHRYTALNGSHGLDTSTWGPRTEIWALKPCDDQGEPLPLAPHVLKGVDASKGELHIQLLRGRRLTGLVLDSEGQPVSDVRITARRPGQVGQAAIAGSARTDEQGGFVIEALQAETLEVVPHQRDARWPDPQPYPLSETETFITLRLPVPTAFRVRVTRSDGEPVVGAMAHVSWVRSGDYLYRRGTTDADGFATLWGVSTRRPLAVHVLRTPSQPSIPEFKRVGVSYADGSINVVLGAQALISGQVLDSRGEPVVAGEIVAEGVEPETMAFTVTTSPDQSGGFTLRVKPGAYRIWLRENPNLPESRPVLIEAPSQGLRLVVPPPVDVRGVLRVAEPQRWRVQWLTEPRTLPVTVGPKGAFHIAGIRDDPASLLATRTGDTRVVLLEGVRPSDGALVLRPVPGQVISGTIQGLTERRDTFVRISRGLVRLHVKVGSDMSFSAANVPSGLWQVALYRQHERLAALEQVAAGTTDLRLIVE